MILSFAPMEGVTGHVFRRVHRAFFPQADKYYAPFIAPDSKGDFKISRLRDILPENNGTLCLVPQVLANNAEAFLRVARQLDDLGYRITLLLKEQEAYGRKREIRGYQNAFVIACIGRHIHQYV